MVLDNEMQRQQLIEVLNTIPISGNLQQVTQIADRLSKLIQAVATAPLEDDKVSGVGG